MTQPTNPFFGFCAKGKCKICGAIIESKHPGDFVSCPCGEAAVDTDRWDHRRHRLIGEVESLRNWEADCGCKKCSQKKP